MEDTPAILCGLIVGSVTAMVLAATLHLPWAVSTPEMQPAHRPDAFTAAHPRGVDPDTGPGPALVYLQPH